MFRCPPPQCKSKKFTQGKQIWLRFSLSSNSYRLTDYSDYIDSPDEMEKKPNFNNS